MVDKPTRGQLDWDVPLGQSLDTLEAQATAQAEAARIAAQTNLAASIDASRDRSTHYGTQDAGTITGLSAVIDTQLGTTAVRTTGDQEVDGVKTFLAKPVVPDASWGVAKVAAAGTRDATTFLRGDGTWSVPAGGTTSDGSAGSANALGTFANPVTDPNAPRPTGLTRVVWDTVTDPVNWVINDYNLQKGT